MSGLPNTHDIAELHEALATIAEEDAVIARSQAEKSKAERFIEGAQQRQAEARQKVDKLMARPISSSPESVSGDRIKAYTPGSFGSAGSTQRRVAIVLNDYHLRNLRWLLRHAWHGHAPENLNTGDWCGEILWALEQAMIESGLTGRDAWANGPDGGWPLVGYSTPEFYSKLRAHLEIVESPDVR